jgi:hypothetical protein
MIVKVQHFKDNFVDSYTEEIYSNVERIFKTRDVNDDIFINLVIKEQETLELIPVTHIDENGNHSSLVGAIWLMNNEGKTIERLI